MARPPIWGHGNMVGTYGRAANTQRWVVHARRRRCMMRMRMMMLQGGGVRVSVAVVKRCCSSGS